MSTDIYKTLDTISSSSRYNSWIYKKICPYLSGNVLDIGSGLGDIAQYYHLNPKVKQIILTDYSDEMLPRLKSRFAHLNSYRALKFDITANRLDDLFSPQGIDTITCVNVLEHIENDVNALNNMHSLLKKKGTLILLIPALPQIYGTLDALVGHYRRYTKTSLQKVIQKTNFTIVKQFYMNMFGIITWFIAGKILKQKSFNAKACKGLDKIVPVLEGIESFIQPPFGQSLITICSAS